MDKNGQEIFFGLVGPLGTNLDDVTNALISALREVKYKTKLIHLSKILKQTDVWVDLEDSYYETYISAHQKMGDAFREKAGLKDALAITGIAKIQEIRDSSGSGKQEPRWNTAYIIRSLKLPQEIDRLRSVYGANFYVISAFARRKNRVKQIAVEIAKSHHQPTRGNDYRAEAEALIKIDENETRINIYGQNVEDAFPKGDFFVDTSFNKDKLNEDINRIIEMLFGHPYHTPTRDEYAMFHAKAAALRSSDLSRQVGAAIVNEDGDVLSVGTNEVPKVGGGLYWSDGDCDHRDFTLKEDTSTAYKREALAEVISILYEEEYITNQHKEDANKDSKTLILDEVIGDVLPLMKRTQLMNVGEFGRTVHAEMSALMDAARRGIPVKNMRLYSTTYPCHNCAKHIIAAGIEKVIYVEPYPKSLATSLHSDEINSDDEGKDGISLESFVGVAPRMYMSLFEITNRKTSDGNMHEWGKMKENAIPRLPETNAHIGYVRKELEVLDLLN